MSEYLTSELRRHCDVTRIDADRLIVSDSGVNVYDPSFLGGEVAIRGRGLLTLVTSPLLVG